jgi:predicted GIY-YIG superfamily endonuclease
MFIFWRAGPTAFCTWELRTTLFEEFTNIATDSLQVFTKKYAVKRLVYFEHYEEIQAAIQREHNIKHWSRKWKVRLILAGNPEGNDLYDSIT